MCLNSEVLKLTRVAMIISLKIHILTLKVPITTAADNIHKYFFIVFLRYQQISTDMKHELLFSSQDKSKRSASIVIERFKG